MYAKHPPLRLILAPLAALLGLVALAVCLALASGGRAFCGGPSSGTVKGVPARLIPIYQRAAARYRLGPRGPAILAAINWEETSFGANLGVSSAQAEGWMQFLPSSWDAYGVDANGDGVKDPYNPWDAIFAAARLLRAAGAPGDWYGAIFSYNHADWYVEDVLADAKKFDGGARAAVAGVGCAGGAASLRGAEKLYGPRAFKQLPAKLWVGGGSPESVDARIWPDAVWLLETYELRATAAREAGHKSHGDGTALDMVPAAGRGWDGTALRAALDLGWTAECGSNGLDRSAGGLCDLVPAIVFIGYNGYHAHGDPAHIDSGSPHIHISWKASERGCAELCAPHEWVMAFPLGAL